MKQLRYETVLFDLDGTLLDTLEDLGEAVNHALSIRGFPTHATKAYRQKVGHGVRNLVKVSLPEALQDDDQIIDASLADFTAWYTAHIDVHTRPYPGMQELLNRLHQRNVKLAIASNKFQEGTERLVGEFFPGIPFVAVLGNRPGYPLKPDPEIVGEVLRRTGSAASSAILVGDSATDMLTARNGGIRSIAVTWGYRPMVSTAEYPAVASAEELESLLLG
ncbi:MAG: HAD-IA family hydrolase [Bacteroidales bacterium]|nr:HAD-IA family hydrolase [Bacteroidales bacterium]